MKTKLLIMLAAMLLSAGAFAQSENTPLKGDVNGDGKVDIADINEIIKIMKDAGGTAEPNTYYWYVGQTDPSTMTSISPIVTDNSSPGWRKINDDLSTYGPSKKIWDGSQISIGETKKTAYVALPNNTLFMFDSLGNRSSAAWTSIGTKNINGVTYMIYSSVANIKTFGYCIY